MTAIAKLIETAATHRERVVFYAIRERCLHHGEDRAERIALAAIEGAPSHDAAIAILAARPQMWA